MFHTLALTYLEFFNNLFLECFILHVNVATSPSGEKFGQATFVEVCKRHHPSAGSHPSRRIIGFLI